MGMIRMMGVMGVIGVIGVIGVVDFGGRQIQKGVLSDGVMELIVLTGLSGWA